MSPLSGKATHMKKNGFFSQIDCGSPIIQIKKILKLLNY